MTTAASLLATSALALWLFSRLRRHRHRWSPRHFDPRMLALLTEGERGDFYRLVDGWDRGRRTRR